MKKRILVILSIVFIVSLIPLLMVSFYSFPNADDFGFGNFTHKAFVNGGFLAVLKMAIYNVIDFYRNWQGTYSAIFMFSLQPGIFGERFYFISHIFLICSFIGANFYFLNKVFSKMLDKYIKYIIILLVLLVQIQFVYDGVSSFYWYNGSIYYTFFYSLELILFAFLISDKPKWYLIFPLTIFIAGGNYVTALNLSIILFIFVVLKFYFKNKDKYLYLINFLLMLIFFTVSIKAPGNNVRALYYNEVSLNAIKAIYYSFVQAFRYSFKIFNISSIVSIIIILILLKDSYAKFNFKYPLIVILFSFGLYAAHFTAPLYAMGIDNLWTRIINIIYFKSYFIILFCGYYVIGYFKIYRYFNFNLLKFIVSAFLFSLILNYQNSLSFQSFNSLYDGSAKDYHRQWLERLELLNNPKLKKIKFDSIKNRAKPIFFMDGNDDGDDWIQRQMSDYYDKELIIIE